MNSKTRISNNEGLRQPSVSIKISPGHITPAMKTAWQNWWRERIASVLKELGNQENNKHA